MKCKEAEQLILLQDSGELPENQVSPLSSHVKSCDPCQNFQQILTESQQAFLPMEEPEAKVMQDTLREIRLQAPEKKKARIFILRPAFAAAASLLIGLGIFLTNFNPNKVGMELVVTETLMLESSDQLVSIMYEGLSEDDLAFNFLMTYEGSNGS